MRETIALMLFCFLMVLASLGVLLWAILQGNIFSMDGLLLAAICLLVSSVFGICFVWLAHDTGLGEMLRRPRQASSEPARTNPESDSKP